MTKYPRSGWNIHAHTKKEHPLSTHLNNAFKTDRERKMTLV